MSTTIQNKIQIKRGNSAPTVGILDEGEPGYDLKNKRLYIGNGEDDSVPTCFPNSKEVVFQGEDVEDGGSVIINADSLTGKIKTLFSDVEKTEPLFPRTKTKAITNDEGVSLDVLLANITPDSLENNSIKAWAVSLNTGAYAYAYAYPSTMDMPAGISDTTNAYAIISATIIKAGHWIELRATFVLTGCQAVILYNNGWGEWEWLNPPMTFGVEYRTTERYMGKPVYAKCVNYGYITAGEHSIAHGIESIDEIVGLEMINKTYGIFTSYFNASADRTNVNLNTPWSMGGFVYIMKYTKL